MPTQPPSSLSWPNDRRAQSTLAPPLRTIRLAADEDGPVAPEVMPRSSQVYRDGLRFHAGLLLAACPLPMPAPAGFDAGLLTERYH
jgi:hypothetical protein